MSLKSSIINYHWNYFYAFFSIDSKSIISNSYILVYNFEIGEVSWGVPASLRKSFSTFYGLYKACARNDDTRA